MRIAVITDTHYLIGEDVTQSALWNRQLLDRTKLLGDSLVQSIRAQSPDLVLHCGDITHEGDRKSFEFAVDVFEQFGVPFFATLGNHDPKLPNSRKFFKSLFHRQPHTHCYAIDLPSVRIVVLDSSFGILQSNEFSNEMNWTTPEKYLGVGPDTLALEQLTNLLEEREDTPTILASHYPLSVRPTYPALIPRANSLSERKLEPLSEKLFLPGNLTQIRQIIFEHPPNLILNGHVHFFDRINENGIDFVSTGALCEYPFRFRMLEFFEDSVSITSPSLLNSDEFEELSLEPQWNNSWVLGEEYVRTFRLKIK